MDPLLAGITLGTFVKDLVELGLKIKESIEKVGKSVDDRRGATECSSGPRE